MIYDTVIRQPNQAVMAEVNLTGLTKLVAEESPLSILLVSPDVKKKSKEQKELEMTEWREHRSPYPTEVRVNYVKIPGRVLTKNGKFPKILHAYLPIRFAMPIAEEETYGDVKQRIEKESMRAVKRLQEYRKEANAFCIVNLDVCAYELSNSAKQCMPISGDNFIDDTARRVLIPRITFDLCLFLIET
ncbi:hypothetical protein HY486_00215 [Candidatus Woesearchaeota archaeon]|nr:hypothetical protein [Candidatus Woesearchaeota archaeon]